MIMICCLSTKLAFSQGSIVNQFLENYVNIMLNLHKRKDIRVIFCDIFTVIDNVWIKGLIFKLKNPGFVANVLEWIDLYLTDKQKSVLRMVFSYILLKYTR